MKLLLIFFVPLFSFSQVITSPIENIELELQNHFMGEGVWTNQIQFIGHPNAIARFETGSIGSVLQEQGFEEGIFISTGLAYDDTIPFFGPNTSPNFGSDNNMAGISTNLSIPLELVGALFYDVAGLQFQLTTLGDTLWFDFIFGSEEYNEYVGTQFNDFFAIYIKELADSTFVNVAQLDNQSIISVNNINNGQNNDGPCLNCAFYINNGNGVNQEPYLSNPYYIQFDGFTKPISPFIPVEPGKIYDVQIIVSDVNDPIYDSGVFLKKGSIKTNSVNKNLAPGTFKLFPNPTKGQFSIQSTVYAKQIRIFSNQGQELFHQLVDAKLTHSIDLSHFSPGIYLIEFQTETGIAFEQIRIE